MCSLGQPENGCVKQLPSTPTLKPEVRHKAGCISSLLSRFSLLQSTMHSYSKLRQLIH